jgi:hypothetical protein
LPEQNFHAQNPQPKQFRYSGLSMRSTFTAGQMLYLRPEARNIQPGDVVIYRRGEEHIVHRVYAVTPAGLRTRGDDNPMVDGLIVPLDDIVGVVEGAEGTEGLQPVIGGRRGLCKARLRWGIRGFFTRRLPWLGAPYRWLKAKRWVNRFWQPQVTTVRLKSDNGVVVKYVVRGKTVATWQAQEARFTCSKPYDLVIFPPETH